MHVFEMVVYVVAIACFAGVLNRYLKTRERDTDVDHGELTQQVEDLEERVRVLERVVTDDRNNLGREIDALKD